MKKNECIFHIFYQIKAFKGTFKKLLNLKKYLPHYWWDKGTVVNLWLPSFHGKSLQITLTAPLRTEDGEPIYFLRHVELT